jgi:hypothetical protein
MQSRCAITTLILCACIWPMQPSTASDAGAHSNDWVLVKETGDQQVYNRQARVESDVPLLKVVGDIEVPYSNAVAIVWDAHYAYPEFVSDHLISSKRVNPTEDNRHDLYIYRMPLFARLAVRAGSWLRGSIGKYQYCTVNMALRESEGRTRISWRKVPTPEHERPIKSAHEMERAEGYWEMTPLDATRTRLVYVVDAYPGGFRVPESMIRWANNTAIDLPRTIERRYRDLQARSPLLQGH